MNNFASMLKYLREREGLSQRELAAKLGMSASAICMYENGNRQPKFEDEETIADFFNVDLNTLRGRRTYTDADYEEISKAMQLYSSYVNASSEVRQAVEILLKQVKPAIENLQNQVKPVVDNWQRMSEQIPHLEAPKSSRELPHLKKDTDK